MKGKEITAAIKIAEKKKDESGDAARRELWGLAESSAPIPSRQASAYYAWLAHQMKYDSSCRQANGSFRSPGVWGSLGRMDPAHVGSFAKALRGVLDEPGGFPERPMLHFLCQSEPAPYLEELSEGAAGEEGLRFIARMHAASILCMSPKAPTKTYTSKLVKLASDPTAMEAAHRLCHEAADTVSYWDFEFMAGLLAMLAVEDGKKSRTSIKKALAFLKTEKRDDWFIFTLKDAKKVLADYAK